MACCLLCHTNSFLDLLHPFSFHLKIITIFSQKMNEFVVPVAGDFQECGYQLLSGGMGMPGPFQRYMDVILENYSNLISFSKILYNNQNLSFYNFCLLYCEFLISIPRESFGFVEVEMECFIVYFLISHPLDLIPSSLTVCSLLANELDLILELL